MLQHYLVAAVVSYLLGSVPFGFLIAKLKGVDLRNSGSGNIGATNVYRVVGKREGLITLVLDVAKGTIPVVIFSLMFPKEQYINVISGFSAVLGHDFSVFLRFRGGKGVATSYGVTLPVYPLASLVGAFIWITILLTTRFSSLAALLSFLIATLIALSSPDYIVRIFFIVLYILMVFKHKDNLKRLFNKEENRIKI